MPSSKTCSDDRDEETDAVPEFVIDSPYGVDTDDSIIAITQCHQCGVVIGYDKDYEPVVNGENTHFHKCETASYVHTERGWRMESAYRWKSDTLIAQCVNCGATIMETVKKSGTIQVSFSIEMECGKCGTWHSYTVPAVLAKRRKRTA